VKPFAVAFVLAELADAVTFALVTTHLNLGGEVNPLARGLFLVSGSLGVWALKAVGIASVIAAAVLLARTRPRLTSGLLGLLAVAAAGCATLNVVFA
jgi:hypothetical protein